LLLVSGPQFDAARAAAIEQPRENATAEAPDEAAQTGARSDSAPTEESRPRFDEVLEVLEPDSAMPGITVLGREDLPQMPAGDGADLLRGISSVTLGRMGGHGLEPRIRGLGESNLNILVDGAAIHGGCPNRMDPPTSFAATGGFDSITVVKGVQSLRYGAGGSAGTVLFERHAPVPDGDRPWRTEASTGYGSWNAEPELSLNATYARESFYLRADAESRRLDSYEDGSGEVVRSAFESRVANLMVGAGNRDRGLVELGYERSRTDDALFGGADMDSPYDRGETFRLKLHRQAAVGLWTGLHAELYVSQVEHLMDNYSLRPRTAPMAMRVPTSSDTTGGRASGSLGVGERLLLTLGVDTERNERRARRYAGPAPQRVTVLQAVMWPDAELTQTGLFAEGERTLGTGSRLRFGLRLDSFEASAGAADLAPTGSNPSPNRLYDLYYGQTAKPWSETGLSALLRYERSLRSGRTLFTGVSRSLSAPDATARYLGAGNPNPAQRWVGNPGLDVAAHHQVDLGFAAAAARHSWTATTFLDRVTDFVLRDRARGQPGILLADRASIYRNVDARLVGLELDGSWAVSGRLTLSGNAAWVRADNRTDDRPLAQIPPLQGVAAAEWARAAWHASAALRWALEQDRVDADPATGSGLDFGPTPGHAVLDFRVAIPLGRGLEMLTGIDNLFDATWADHLNRGNLFDPDPVRVNEPGRAAWLRLRWLGGGQRPQKP
jgi:iron complex outermembrane receptor protein